MLPVRRLHAGLLRRWFIRRGIRFEVRACPTVVVAPHQDDETIGCGGLIALKRRAGGAVTVVILTDGSNYEGRDADVASADIAALRRREALAATTALGVPDEDVHFLNGPDGGLSTLSPIARASVVQQLTDVLRAAGPNEVYVTHRRDGHPDHEAAYELTRDAIARSGSAAELWQYPIWMTWVAPLGLRINPSDLSRMRVVAIDSAVEAKARALAAYPSQLTTLPPHFLDSFGHPFEVFFIAPTV